MARLRVSRDIGILNATGRPPTEDLGEFPEVTRRTAGYELRKLQRGELPDDWRPFPEVGWGVNEIRIDSPDGWFRVM